MKGIRLFWFLYADDNDSLALSIMQDLYPDKEVIGIDCRNMFYWGGMVHCVTQQQPASEVITTSLSANHKDLQLLVYPNPASEWLFVQTPFQSGKTLYSGYAGPGPVAGNTFSGSV